MVTACAVQVGQLAGECCIIHNNNTRGTLRTILAQLEQIIEQVGAIEGKDRQDQV